MPDLESEMADRAARVAAEQAARETARSNRDAENRRRQAEAQAERDRELAAARALGAPIVNLLVARGVRTYRIWDPYVAGVEKYTASSKSGTREATREVTRYRSERMGWRVLDVVSHPDPSDYPFSISTTRYGIDDSGLPFSYESKYDEWRIKHHRSDSQAPGITDPKALSGAEALVFLEGDQFRDAVAHLLATRQQHTVHVGSVPRHLR